MPTNEELQNQFRQMIQDRSFAIEYALQYVGTFYSWGGDDPAAWDCSGLLSEIAQAVGYIKRNERLTAEGFRTRFIEYKIDEMIPGCAVIFFDKEQNKATHIEMAISRGRTIGASGGGSKTITKEDAMRDNAFVKIRPLNTGDKREIIFLDPIMSLYPDIWKESTSKLIIPEKNIIRGNKNVN